MVCMVLRETYIPFLYSDTSWTGFAETLLMKTTLTNWVLWWSGWERTHTCNHRSVKCPQTHLASFPGHSQILSCSSEEKSGSGLGMRLGLTPCPWKMFWVKIQTHVHVPIVAVASIHSTWMRVAADAHWAISRAVCVLRLISTIDSRTQRLLILLPASIRPSCITVMYLIQLLLLSAQLPNEINAAL